MMDHFCPRCLLDGTGYGRHSKGCLIGKNYFELAKEELGEDLARYYFVELKPWYEISVSHPEQDSGKSSDSDACP